MKPKTDISFIILTWNSESYIQKCMDSLISALGRTDLTYHIYITDNGSMDKTPDILNALKNKMPVMVTLFMLDRNMGTTYSRNLGLKKADSRYVCVMDSDVEVFPGTIDGLIAVLEKNHHTGLAVPKIVYPDGRLQKSTDSFPTIGRKIYRYCFLKKMEKTEALKSQSNESVNVDYAISAFWIMKKNMLDKIGLLDEKIFYSPEDADYCLRIWQSGYRIIYDNSVFVIHHTQELSRGFKLNKAFINHIKGLVYYFFKHRYFFKKPVFKK
ncbi:MAG: glycosyltransferase family 2 protein [Desulfobacula sp.]|nr:glycosyltransferase family 2 protein [Desulfobacula sp.]